MSRSAATNPDSALPRESPAVLAVVGGLALLLGVVAGWLAASQSGPGGRAAGDAAAHAAPTRSLDPRTLANLGVEVGAVAAADHWLAREVPAVVRIPPESLHPVTAPMGGWVRRVLVRRGERVAAGEPMLELVRDPLPRPSLTLTDAVLRPLNEEYHAAIAGLRTAREALDIAVAELERVRAIVAGPGGDRPPVVTKTEVDLVYEERRARSAYANALHEADRHGMTEEEIKRVEGGGDVEYTLPAAQRVLMRNRLWSDAAARMLAALPQEQRDLPYATAALGELAGAGLLGKEVVEELLARPGLTAAFLEIAGLLQQGWSVAALLALEEAGALEPRFALRAPQGAADWDVAALPVLPGDRVETGATLALCEDPRTVLLELVPAASDLAPLAAALAAGRPLRAEPLLAGGGPAVEGVTLLRIAAEESPEAGANGRAWAEAPNAPLPSGGASGSRFRSWTLRAGQRLVVDLPFRRLEGVFVLPADALAFAGPESILLLEDGDTFRPVPVRVLHRDARTAVIAQDGAIFPGDRVVRRGAAALALALESTMGQGGHAGHGHPH